MMSSDGPGRTSVGVFHIGSRERDLWFGACEGAMGRHGDLEFRPYDREADHILLMGNLLPRFGGPRLSYFAKKVAKVRGRVDARELEEIGRWFGRDPGSISILVYEPSMYYSDEWYRVANCVSARVFGPDDRARYPITLPATWSFPERALLLRGERPSEDRPIDLACITSGKILWEGHSRRLDFIRMLRRAGVRVALFGRGLPGDLADHPDSYGSVQSKASILRGARFTLAIENDASNDRYLSEKLWDPLLCWSLPLYYGSRAADSLIPSGSFVRIPDLSDAGVGVVVDALAQPTLWEDRLEAMGRARGLALGELRITEWARGALPRRGD